MMFFNNVQGLVAQRGFGYGGCGPFSWMGWHMGSVTLIFILGIATLAFLYYEKNKKRSASIQHDSNQALDLLAMRYAKGEIDEEAYIKMKSNLKE